MRKKVLLFALSLLLTFTGVAAENYVLSSNNTSLVISANKDGNANYKYFGPRIEKSEIGGIDGARIGTNQATYPTFGLRSLSEKAIVTQMADGNLSLDLTVTDIQQTTDDNGQLLVITFKDKVYPFVMKQYFKVYNGTDVFSTWVDLENQDKKAISLLRYYSACVPLQRGNNYSSHLEGYWANEGGLYEQPVNNGQIVLSNKEQTCIGRGVSSSIMVTFDGVPQESTGRVFGASLRWTGNHKLILNARDNALTLLAGINDDAATYTLESKEVFTTPELIMAYSTEGKGGVSRAFHRWALKYGLMHGDKLRDILLNSWEGVYMNVNQPVMDQMMADISALGGELFVMDDGWFGDKYPRDTDKSSLGDWVVNKKKLPEGIEGLVASAKKHGVKFGIWIEPEMSNTKSELFENHPEWILQHKNRPLTQGRGGTQVVLDLTNPKVQDYVFSITDNLLTKHPEIAYIKWDNNAEIMNYNSLYLPANRQQELNVRYQMGIQKVLKRIRDKYKDVVIQLCAGGGGRVSYGFLPYFDEFWTSDNTDAMQRLFIQWGDTHFFPAKAMASHVSASPNHQTHRTLPLKFRFDVAMTGRLGMELQPKDMKPEEKEFSKRSIAAYKEIRPIVQEGDLYRLVSPYERKPITALMYANADKSKIVVFAYRMEYLHSQKIEPLLLTGVDENKKYLIKDLTPWEADKPNNLNGKTVSGKILKYMGLGLGQTLNRPESSMAIKLIAQ